VTGVVVDASVAVKWLLREDDSDLAQRIPAVADRLIAPELIGFELGNILWKRIRRGDVTPDEARRHIATFYRMEIEQYPVRFVHFDALAIAVRADISFYDAAYVALADYAALPLITTDLRLARRTALYPAGVEVLTLQDWFSRNPPA